jgi:anthranilate phosphoribosyltransferase
LTAEAAPAVPAGPHPFAKFVRTIGRGSKLSRALDEGEAETAMEMILAGSVEPVQLGAFLLIMRYRKESPAELAGFARAARAAFTDGTIPAAELDWPSYADRHRQLPYFLLAALLLAESGVRVLMHGIEGTGPVTTPAVLAALGIRPCRSPDEAGEALASSGFAYLPLASFCPALVRLFELRPLLGVRSPANTFAREINPGDAPAMMQGVFHPTYLGTHLETARLLGQPRATIFKGGAGEVQRNPEKPCRALTLEDGAAGEDIWPALTRPASHKWRGEPLEPGRIGALWRGGVEAPGPEAAVIGTAAIALKLLGHAATVESAEGLAREMWEARTRKRFG